MAALHSYANNTLFSNSLSSLTLVKLKKGRKHCTVEQEWANLQYFSRIYFNIETC